MTDTAHQSVSNGERMAEVSGSAESSMTAEILKMLSVYERVGIAARERLDDVPLDHHPSNIMPSFRSIIVMARVPKELPEGILAGKFRQAIATIAAQDAVGRYLKHHGYAFQLIGSRSTRISLPRLGERAGVGELSQFRTLAVKGHGLRTVLSAVITDAPLLQSPPASNACQRKERCLKRCAALQPEGTFDRTKCTSCGACVRQCAEG